MMSAAFFRRTDIAVRAFLDIANWREVLPRGARGETVTEIRLRDGTVIAAPPDNALWPHFSDVWYHLAYTKYTPIPRNALVVDVGANVGVFSLLAARRARKVYALEPASSNFERLVRNVAATERIVPLQIACAAKDGLAELNLDTNPVSFSLMTKAESKKTETVSVTALGTFFDHYNIARCDFLKLDCEGSEFEILLDTPASVIQKAERIVMEYHDYLSVRFSHRDLIRRLESLGYRTQLYHQHATCGMLAAVKR
jgi:FkbM family methyltransferase